ncbi:uncharacterized protein LOC122962353, partial [Acropora millepora]|uniref:uncharacterized protein LOC122962353 n=1 Tax=Acropora millepora TaxID=45264 RepID=UPI001CF51CBC
YQDLKREIGRLWGIRHLEVVPVVVGALGVVSKRSIGLMRKGGEIWEPEENVCQVCCMTDLPRVKEKRPGFSNNVWCDLIVYDHTKGQKIHQDHHMQKLTK